ncbi:MAG TPA: sulfur carrier protein ThiS [Limnochordia bacterium]
MRIHMNKESVELPAGSRISDLLQLRGIAPEHVAVAVNGEIVRRDAWSRRALEEGDVVEVVHAVAGGVDEPADPLVIAERTFTSRLFVGTGKYPSMEVMVQALAASGTEMVTVAMRHVSSSANGQAGILERIDRSRYHLLPNTAGATTAEQAIYLARLAREALGTNWIKLEVIGEPETLWPDTAATVEATRTLVAEGFVVLPYTSPDLVAALRLEDAGAATVMPLASPIGSGQGFNDWASIERILERVHVPVVVDAGIGVPSDAALAMEMGAAAVLVNTAIARARDPVRMAAAMRLGVEAGREAFLAGRMPKQRSAAASSPSEGVPQGAPGRAGA